MLRVYNPSTGLVLMSVTGSCSHGCLLLLLVGALTIRHILICHVGQMQGIHEDMFLLPHLWGCHRRPAGVNMDACQCTNYRLLSV